MTPPTIEVREGFEDAPHEVKALMLKEANTQEDLRAAVDGMIGASAAGKDYNVTKEWLAVCLLALGGPEHAPVDVEIGRTGQ